MSAAFLLQGTRCKCLVINAQMPPKAININAFHDRSQFSSAGFVLRETTAQF